MATIDTNIGLGGAPAVVPGLTPVQAPPKSVGGGAGGGVAGYSLVILNTYF